MLECLWGVYSHLSKILHKHLVSEKNKLFMFKLALSFLLTTEESEDAGWLLLHRLAWKTFCYPLQALCYEFSSMVLLIFSSVFLILKCSNTVQLRWEKALLLRCYLQDGFAKQDLTCKKSTSTPNTEDSIKLHGNYIWACKLSLP